uniref:Immunoglobulin V-set domain-containing protein n=1 Tax=Pygocentrus nattereri TaxID=42514 RepID=A0A3B4BPE9_PYGNA
MTIIWIIIFTLTPGELFLSYLFSLDDDTAARVFTITITDLRPEDGGRYWCVVKRPKSLTDLYTEILLLVKSVQTQSTPPSSSPSTGISSFSQSVFLLVDPSVHPVNH